MGPKTGTCVLTARAIKMKASNTALRSRTTARQSNHIMSIPDATVYQPTPAVSKRKTPPTTSRTMQRATATGRSSANEARSHGLILSANGDGGPEIGGIVNPGRSTMANSSFSWLAASKAQLCG
eukprot:CAMPEP_0179078362 /NCGR_PEP_ID=MMETSP0796-20121207/35088_1 /TAXON_ID=73915 /ORGANISM="Pyrodinium bahamense, Strain pbaha01" /LENGTH=123 /DNA_ID=CAMNT_0020775665 /DNA_START=275 /DNA_END=646 /DNA_ORIENTATION=-